jgi:hypothetical protein
MGRQAPELVLRAGEKWPCGRRSEAVAAVLRVRPRSCQGSEGPGQVWLTAASVMARVCVCVPFWLRLHARRQLGQSVCRAFGCTVTWPWRGDREGLARRRCLTRRHPSNSGVSVRRVSARRRHAAAWEPSPSPATVSRRTAPGAPANLRGDRHPRNRHNSRDIPFTV